MITILMAAYNGQKYLAEQIDSVLNQTERDWKLIVQDDCSRDATFAVAKEYSLRYPDRISAVCRESPSGSAQNNFFSMLRFADSEYVMFCDDDDIWLPEKAEITLSEMKRLEKICGQDKPLLVHTDLRVADGALAPLADSMMRMQKLAPSHRKLNHLLVQNNVTGCTMMVNRRLLELAVERGLPRRAVMHDWWFALIASALGRIGFVPRATILYRQHRGNQVGAKNAGSLRYNLGRFLNGAEVRRSLAAAYGQAGEFSERFGPLLGEEQNRILAEFLSIPSRSKPERLRILWKNDFWKSGFLRKFGQIWFL